MAAFTSVDSEEVTLRRDIRITGTNQIESYTVYTVEITVNDCTWSVQHRYSEFVELHEGLIAADKANKSIHLPPKKLIGNSSKSFIQKRQKELQVYLQTVVEKNPTLPKPLLHFLEFDIYDINGVAQALAAELYEKGDEILASEDVCEMTPMQLYAITERLKLPLPTCQSGDARCDIGHVMDFIAQLKYLRIVGSHNKLGNSNRKVDQLPFDLSHFKLLKHLQIDVCDVKLISGIEELKPNLSFLAVHHSASSITEIIVPGMNEWTQASYIQIWQFLKTVDLRYNRLKKIDETLRLVPSIERLDLSFNEISQIENLEHLSHLTHLDLSHNAIVDLDAIHSKLGNVKTLCLAANKLTSLKGLSKLYSVVNLDVSRNSISEVIEVEHLSNLPCIESLMLRDNEVTSVVDYRTKVFELFQERYAEMKLDGQAASQKERDTVAVLKAIQKSKDNEEKLRKSRTHSPHKKKHSSTVHKANIADPGAPTNNGNGDNGKATLLSLAQSIQDPQAAEGSQQGQQGQQDQEFIAQVKAIQKEGGQAWLSMFNEFQQSSPSHSPCGTPKNRSPVMSRRSKSPRPSSRSPHRTPTRSPNRSPNRSPTSSVKVTSQEVEGERPVAVSERFLTPERAVSPAISTDSFQEEFISPKTLANQVCKELEKHRARGITSIQDILSVVFYYEGPHLRTFGPRHRQAGEIPPADAGLSALAVAINMPPEKQQEFLHIMEEKAESDVLSVSPSSPIVSSTVDAVSTDPENVKELLNILKSILQRSESILKAPLEDSEGKRDSNVIGEFQGQVDLQPPQDVVDTVVRQQEREHLTISIQGRRSSSPKAVVPDYDQSVLDHLTACNKNIKMPLSKSVQSIADMSGVELVRFFHEKVADISTEVEMLDHIVWCGVMSFLIPFKEVMSCVMLSDKGVYVMSDEPLNVSSPSPTAFGHRRMKSDSAIGWVARTEDHSGIVGFNAGRSDKTQGNNAGGVLHCPRESTPKKRIKCQTMIKLTDLEEVIMGLFDQKIRLTGNSSDSTITLMICNVLLTQEFKEHLTSVLPIPKSSTPLPMRDSTSGIDFYKPQRHRAETSEYIHPSKVKFCYPNDETIGDLTYLIVINIPGKKPTVDDTNILLYMPVYQIIGNSDLKGSITIKEPIEQNEKCQRTLVITNGHLTLLKEDNVSYPLPSFSKMLPDNPQYDIQEIQSIESLRRLVVSDFSSHDVSLVFEVMEVNVDISRDYYSASTDGHPRRSPVSPEVSWPLVLPSFEDRERLIKLLKGQWMEGTGEELSIQVST